MRGACEAAAAAHEGFGVKEGKLYACVSAPLPPDAFEYLPTEHSVQPVAPDTRNLVYARASYKSGCVRVCV